MTGTGMGVVGVGEADPMPRGRDLFPRLQKCSQDKNSCASSASILLPADLQEYGLSTAPRVLSVFCFLALHLTLEGWGSCMAAAKGQAQGETAPRGTSSHPTSPSYITTNSSSPYKLKQIPNSWRRWTNSELLDWSFMTWVAETILPALKSHGPHWLQVNIVFVKPCKTCFSSDKTFLSPYPCIEKRHWNACSPTTHYNFPFSTKKWKVFLELADSWTCSEAILLS